MLISVVFLLFVGISSQLTDAFPNAEFQEREDAVDFLNELDKRDLEDLMVKRFFYNGKEQRREVKEKYEEKCERKIISSMMKKPRWCPELTEWPEWNKVSANDGKKSG